MGGPKPCQNTVFPYASPYTHVLYRPYLHVSYPYRTRTVPVPYMHPYPHPNPYQLSRTYHLAYGPASKMANRALLSKLVNVKINKYKKNI